MNPSLWAVVLSQLVTAGGAVVVMRSDLAALTERVAGLQRTVDAQGVQVDRLREGRSRGN